MTSLGRIYIHVLVILVVKKVIFWAFSKLFCNCLGSVWAMFSTLKGPLLVVFEPFLILFTTHTCCSPLGSREALKNVDKVSPGLLVPQKRGSLKNLFEWVPLVEWLSLPCLICYQNFTPLRHKLFDVLLCGWWWVGRIYL